MCVFFNGNRSLTSVSRACGVYKLNFEGILELEDSNLASSSLCVSLHKKTRDNVV